MAAALNSAPADGPLTEAPPPPITTVPSFESLSMSTCSIDTGEGAPSEDPPSGPALRAAAAAYLPWQALPSLLPTRYARSLRTSSSSYY